MLTMLNWKLCKGKNGCSRSPSDEMLHAGLSKAKKAA